MIIAVATASCIRADAEAATAITAKGSWSFWGDCKIGKEDISVFRNNSGYFVRIVYLDHVMPTVAVIDIGEESYALRAKYFGPEASPPDSAKLVRAMQRETSLTVRFFDLSPPQTYVYDLTDFAKALAAMDAAAIESKCH
jgi:hypothetical protein